MPDPLSTVIAGSKGFVDAVEAHLRLKLGASPTVAHAPEELSAACGGGGLLVLEYGGSGWLDAIRSVRGHSREGELSIIAAVTQAQAADVTPLQHAGVDEVVRWQGRVDPVLWAVDRLVARPRSSPREALAAAAGADRALAPELGFEIRGLSPEEGLPKAPPSSPARPEPLPEMKLEQSGVLWPRFIPASEAALELLARAAGGQGGGAMGPGVENVLRTCSDAERAALSGAGESGIDAALLREAAALRLRLALALASAPSTPDGADQAAAQQLLGDVDAVLARIKAAMEAEGGAAAPALEPIRNAIVGGGVDLAVALSRLVPEGSPEREALEKAEKKLATRVLKNESVAEAPRLSAASKGLWFAFAVAFLIAAGYHGWRYVTKPVPQTPPTLPGAPQNTTTVTRGPVRMLTVMAGKKVDPAELERFRTAEQAKGNELHELSPGTWAIEPARPAEGEKKP